MVLAGIVAGFQATFAGGGGGQVKALAVLDGSRHQIQKDSTITVQDSAFYNPAYAGLLSSSYTVQNQVTVMINEASTRYMPSKFSVTVKLHISWDSAGHTDTVNRSFTVNYDSSATYNSRSSFVFQGAHQVTVKVISDSTDATGWDPTSVLLVENQLTAWPVFAFNCKATIGNITISPSGDTTADELPVSWNAIVGADQYDLEWTYIDSSALRDGRYNINRNTTQPLDLGLIFKNNATRVTTTGTSYRIPLIYDDSGTVFVRVRPTQLGAAGSVTAAIWSSEAGTPVVGRYTYTGHERPLNWQSNISYAEEGKRKVVLQYFDGSLRSRQTVTKDNSTNTTVVAETYYDYQGRPALQVMPAPTLNTIIKYTAGFNQGYNSAEYNQANFDTVTSTQTICDARADSMVNTAGASMYYSPQNPQANIGLNQFIPDAEDYPFTQTEYMPDNTGRISRQGGVGKNHQLGTGHETKYYYGTPDQNELDALFGTEVGDKSHYFKNMVRDANGQYSVSYVDMHGRTIATALAGAAPAGMSPLASNNTKSVTETLADPSTASIQDQSMVSQKSLLVSKADTFSFHYSLLPDSLKELNCNQQAICYTCRYDLDITITDNCNNSTWGGQAYTQSRHNFSLATLANSCQDTAIDFSFQVPLPEGSYLITKKLTVNKDAYNFYRDSIYLPNNTCTSLTQFIQQQKSVIASKTGQCSPDCASCQASVGDWPTFLANYNKSIGLSAGDTTYQQEANSAWQNAMSACAALCQTTTAYNDIRSAMLQDMTPPYGQYADTLKAIDADQYSIFYFKRDDTSFASPFQRPSIRYTDVNGKPDSVYNLESGLMVTPNTLSRAQFVANFRASWADSLLLYHPEYCRLLVLQNNNLSLQWDRKAESIDTYADASAAGFMNPLTSSNPDPLATSNSTYRSKITDALNVYTTVQGAQMSMWGLALAIVKSDSGDKASFEKFKNPLDPSLAAAMCPGDLDMAWRHFRELYQARKQQLFSDLLLANPSGCHPLNTWANPALPQVSYLQSHQHQSEFSDVSSTIKGQTSLQDYVDAGQSPTAAFNQQARLRDSLAQYFDQNVSSYAIQWYRQLTACTLYTDTVDLKNTLIGGLKTLCRQACDADHPYGASSLPGTTTIPVNGHNVNNFQQIITNYNLSKGITDAVHCNAELITSPLPYDNQPVYSLKPVYGRPSDCECSMINDLYNRYLLAGHGDANFAAYLSRTQQITLTQGQLDTLRTMCSNTTNTLSCRNLSKPIYLPPAMQCHTGQTCSSCHTIDSLYSAFQVQYPGIVPSDSSDSDTAQATKNVLFQNFMNNRLGYSLQAWQYMQFMDTCKAHPEDTAVAKNCLGKTVAELFNSGAQDTMFSIVSTPDGGYVLAGMRRTSSDWYSSAYLIRYNAAGSVQWKKSYVGSQESNFYKVRRTSDNGYVAVGVAYYDGTGINHDSTGKVFVVRVDAAGNTLWQKSFGFGSVRGELAVDIIQTRDGGYAIVGDHDIDQDHVGPATILALKLDASGNLSWAKGMAVPGLPMGMTDMGY
ncbi:hypothetical protein ACQ86N_41175 [Puia sp. P3]|uniref:hypothetical protein n=1 Tax=Puia sp. P3 TaxID=3423952 RepID=UPI003D671C85